MLPSKRVARWLIGSCVALASCNSGPTAVDQREHDERRVVALAQFLFQELPRQAANEPFWVADERALPALEELGTLLGRLLGREEPANVDGDREAVAAMFEIVRRRDPRLYAHLTKATEAARAARTRISLEQIGQALELYRLDTGRYPDSERWTDALLGRGESRQAYLSTEGASHLVDGWGQPIRLEMTEAGVRLRSCGPDEAPDTADDITRGP